MPCQQKQLFSAIAGGFVAMNPTLPIIGNPATLLPLPPMVHYAAAGVAVDALCRGPDVLSNMQEVGMSAVLGVVGATAFGMLRNVV